VQRNRLTLLRLRDEVVPAFLSAMMRETDWGKFAVVGFSSVFQQTAASLALARRIKAAHPHVRIVFGGSNFDDEMGHELFRRVDALDPNVADVPSVSVGIIISPPLAADRRWP